MMKLRIRRKKAQSMVEFALILPLLLALLLGLADFGFLLYAHVQVTNATREGTRAASLYLTDRFHYTSCKDSCQTGYGYDTSNCWTLRDWVENGLVERNRDPNSGCPVAGYNTAIHSFGLLSPNTCGSANCWELVSLTSNGTPITGDPVAGEPLQVRVVYRYNMLFLGDLVGFTANPILIDRTVIMKVQNT